MLGAAGQAGVALAADQAPTAFLNASQLDGYVNSNGSMIIHGLQTGVVKRCPGMASQAATDGSSPFRDFDGSLDCDPGLAPPGP